MSDETPPEWCCPLCCRPYDKAERRRTRDHIFPVQWGGTDIMHGDVRNTRDMCGICNGWRGNVGHCVGALQAARAVASADIGRSLRAVLRLWRMASVVATIKHPIKLAPPASASLPASVSVAKQIVSTPPEPRPYTLKNLRAKSKGPAKTLPKELVTAGGIVAMRWNVRGTGRALF